MDKKPLDETLTTMMQHLFNIIRPYDTTLTDAELRCLIVSSNLRGLAEALLVAEEHGNPIHIKKTALGLLGTADWLKGDIEPTQKMVELNKDERT